MRVALEIRTSIATSAGKEDVLKQPKLRDEILFAFIYQFLFNRRTSPEEVEQWDLKELKSIRIDHENIVNLYYIKTNLKTNDNFPCFNNWEICCRSVYGSQNYFVNMYTDCEFKTRMDRCIFITRFPNFYLQNLVISGQALNTVYVALIQEGFEVEKPNPFSQN